MVRIPFILKSHLLHSTNNKCPSIIDIPWDVFITHVPMDCVTKSSERCATSSPAPLSYRIPCRSYMYFFLPDASGVYGNDSQDWCPPGFQWPIKCHVKQEAINGWFWTNQSLTRDTHWNHGWEPIGQRSYLPKQVSTTHSIPRVKVCYLYNSQIPLKHWRQIL